MSNNDDRLYRFISFQSFVDIVLSKELTLVHPNKFEDPFENLFYKTMFSSCMTSYDTGVPNQADSTSSVWSFLMMLLWKTDYLSTCVQCWTKTAESDALWRIYSFNKSSIRIAVKRQMLEQLDDCALVDVCYENKTIEQLSDVLFDTNNPNAHKRIYAYKRPEFSHENEVRLLHQYKSKDGNLDIDQFLSASDIADIDLTTTDDLAKGWQKVSLFLQSQNITKVKKIPIMDVPSFIDSVMLNPFAEEWFSKTVSLFCTQHSLNYVGKSRLYLFPEG